MTGKIVRAAASAAVILICSVSVLRIFAGEQYKYDSGSAVRAVPQFTAESTKGGEVTKESTLSTAENTIQTEIITTQSEIPRENTDAENSLVEEYENIVEFPLDLNSADFEELKQLPGIGETLAAEIMAYRESIGGFSSREQLLDIKGIGQERYSRIYPLLYINGEMPYYKEENHTDKEEIPTELHTEYDGTIIDVNKASAEDFDRLPGVDIELGREIVRLREEIGGFCNILELLYAEGMTDALYVSIDEFLVCEKEQY